VDSDTDRRHRSIFQESADRGRARRFSRDAVSDYDSAGCWPPRVVNPRRYGLVPYACEVKLQPVGPNTSAATSRYPINLPGI
jgi:hypothetical protein